MEPTRCPECGAALTAEQARSGPCPSCLIHLGLAASEPSPVPPAPPPGTAGDPPAIGPYRIVRRLGEGGMGIVYLAEQEAPVRRRVALKIVKRGVGTHEVIRRFDAERQALALMDHPSIARVHDAGETPDGLPYFAMEYVEGEPITDHCDRERLGMRARLELLSEVCAAIQHAHRKGVIHRDLKPSNVLVARTEGAAIPKVIDFGVAKAIQHRATERSLFTEFGTIVGTPEYMSPEQAEFTGERVDTRTDVYSLGVLQYELLTGALPFDPAGLRAGGFDEICRRIREEEPPRPSARVGGPGAAATDPAQPARLRGTDAAALRRQLEGELDWITMKALEKDPARRYGSPQELADDLRRYLRHEPVLAGPPSAAYRMRKFVRRHRFGVASAAAVLAAVLLGAVAATTFALREAAERRRTERARAELEKVAAFQASMIADVDPQAIGGRLLADLRRRIGDAARTGGTPAAEVESLERRLDRALAGVNGTDAALRVLDEEILERAARAIESEFAREPLIEARLLASLAETYRRIGLSGKARPHFERALELRRGALGPDHPDSLESLNALAANRQAEGRFAEAEAAYREADDRARRALGKDHPLTLMARNGLGSACRKQGRYAEAEALLVETLEARRRIQGSESSEVASTLHELAEVYEFSGRTALVEPLLVEVVAIRTRVSGPDHPLTLSSIERLAGCTRSRGRLADAQVQYLDLLERQRRVRGTEHTDVLTTLGNLSTVYYAQKQVAEGEAIALEALEISRRTRGPDHLDTLQLELNLAGARVNAGRLKEAEEIYESGLLDRLRRAVGPDHHFTLAARQTLGILYYRAKRYEEAAREFRATADHPRATADVKSQMAAFLISPWPGRDPAAAVRYAAQAVEMTGRASSSALRFLALAYESKGDIEAAGSIHEELVAIGSAGAREFNSYAWFLLTRAPETPAGDATALEYALRANEHSGHKNPEHLDTLSLAYHRAGRGDEAVATLEKALLLIPAGETARRGPFLKRLEEYKAALQSPGR